MRDHIMLRVDPPWKPPTRALPVRFLTTVLIATASGAFGAALLSVVAPLGDMAPIALVGLPLAALLAAGVFVEPVLGAVLVILAFPLGFASAELGPFRLQAVEAAIVVAAVLVALRQIALGRAPLSWSPQLLWAVAFVSWAVVATPSATDPVLAVKHVGSLVLGLVFASVVLTVGDSIDHLKRFLAVLVAASSAITFHALLHIGQLRAAFGGAIVTGRPQGLFTEPNELGSFCALNGFAAIALLFHAKTRAGRAACLVGGSLLFTGLLMSLSRGAWISVIVATAFLALVLREARKVIIVVAVPLISLGVLIGGFSSSSPQVSVVGERIASVADLEQPYEDRPSIWREALRQIRADPWTGHGPGNFSVVSRRAASRSLTVYASHAHQLYLNIGAELGLPALALFVAFAAAVAATARRAARSASRAGRWNDRAFIVVVGAALLSLLVQGLVNTFMGNVIIDATAWGLVGVLLGAARLTERGREASTRQADAELAATAT